MAISLNNHESRITALENKSGISLTSGSGWVDFSNGLQMRFGSITINGKEVKRSFTFQKPFSSSLISITAGENISNNKYQDSTCVFSEVTKSGFNACNNLFAEGAGQANLNAYYIAIGY